MEVMGPLDGCWKPWVSFKQKNGIFVKNCLLNETHKKLLCLLLLCEHNNFSNIFIMLHNPEILCPIFIILQLHKNQ